MLFHFAFSGKIIFSKKMTIQKKIIIDNYRETEHFESKLKKRSQMLP